MGSTLSAPCAYLQKQGCPWIGIPASLEIFRSWSVKILSKLYSTCTQKHLFKSVRVILVCSLEDLFSALPLRGETGDGPHLDLHSGVELFAPHVPHPVAWSGHRAVLRRQRRVQTRIDKPETKPGLNVS